MARGPTVPAQAPRNAKWFRGRNRLVMSDPAALAGEFCLLRITEAGDDGDASAIISAVRGG